MSATRPGPQFLRVVQKSLPGTLYSCKWLDHGARLVVTGGTLKGGGLIQVYELGESSLQICTESVSDSTVRCAIVDAASTDQEDLAIGTASGELQLYKLGSDIQRFASIQGHKGMINSISGCSGKDAGSWLIVTGGADGTVKIWDSRQQPVVASFPSEQASVSEGHAAPAECWSVACGNAHEGGEQCVLAGYSDGGLTLFDMRAGAVRWRSSGGGPKSGIVATAFDRGDIPINKFTAASMDSKLRVFDARTQHSTLGFAEHTEVIPGDSTLWGCAHLPQHRDICLTHGGDGYLRLFKYRYPDRRKVKDMDTQEDKGIAGSFDSLSNHCISEQPISAFDWNSGKTGLFCCTALDQTLRVGLVTRLHLY